MPLRTYRCEAGHEFDVIESMDGPKQTICPEPAEGDDGSSICGLEVEQIIALQQRPIVKGGTKVFHPGRMR